MTISFCVSPVVRMVVAGRCWLKWDWWVRRQGRYNLHLGGNRNGTRIPKMYRENITVEQILTELDSLVGRWAKEREAGEDFGDFTIRAGIIEPVLISKRDFYA